MPVRDWRDEARDREERAIAAVTDPVARILLGSMDDPMISDESWKRLEDAYRAGQLDGAFSAIPAMPPY